MSWYKEYKNEWKEIIETVASEKHRTPQMVEKDTIQSMLLLALSESNIPFVFKGGTSLSKAFKIIDRFSEDLDISLSKKPTASEKNTIKKTILESAEVIDLVLANPDSIKSRYNFNKYIFEYESLFSEKPLELLIETSFYNMAYPAETKIIHSYVGDFCKEKNITLPITFVASSFNMQVQSLERTFIDKVFAICDYNIQERRDRESRHLYDIAKIVNEIELTPQLKDLVLAVRFDRMQSRNCPSSQPQCDITEILTEIINTHYFESDYNNITKRLLFEEMTYSEAIDSGISQILHTNIFSADNN